MMSSKSHRLSVRLVVIASIAFFAGASWMFSTHAAIISPSGAALSCTESVNCSAVVAIFTSNDPMPQLAANYSATINWDDGSTSTGTITSNGSGGFNVSGGHTYSEEGTFQIAVVIHDSVDNSQSTVNGSATVADAPLSQFSLASLGPPLAFSGAGTAGATNAFNAFRTGIGGINNGANPPPQAGGFREINWDGVLLNGTDFGGNTVVISP